MEKPGEEEVGRDFQEWGVEPHGSADCCDVGPFMAGISASCGERSEAARTAGWDGLINEIADPDLDWGHGDFQSAALTNLAYPLLLR